MNQIRSSRCPGTLNRRSFLHLGLAGLGSLGLTDLLRLQALAAPEHSSPKALLVLWLWGGPSHMETFDLKPDAPAEYRGEFSPIATNVPGIQISEHLPRLARHADKFAILRSLHHPSTGHVSSTHTLISAYPGEIVETAPYRPRHPDVYAVASKLLGPRRRDMLPYFAIPRTRYNGGAYLGPGLEPMTIGGDPNNPDFHPPRVHIEAALRPHFTERLNLLQQFDDMRRELDGAEQMQAMDRFQVEATRILNNDTMQRAFDIHAEDARIRDRYGRHEIGQRCLLARRLIEAGARVVTVDFPCVPGQKAFSWDDHASVWNIFEQMKIRLPVLDQVVSALIDDLYQRGLQNDVLLLVMGEMSHTPRLSNFNGQPGREHWAQSMSLLLAGGGLRMGQVIGSTNARGEEPRDRPVSANDFQATLYHYLGVSPCTYFANHSGQPIALLPSGRPIAELTR